MASAHRPLARDERERRSIGSETAALRRVSERGGILRTARPGASSARPRDPIDVLSSGAS
jgi:hypothetical protein